MNAQQILGQMLSFSVEQHGIKDKTIENLQQRVTELEKQLASYTTSNKAETKSKAN